MSGSRLVRHIVLAGALGGAVALGLALVANLPATLDALARFRWRLLPLVLAAVLLNWALRFVKWHYCVRRLSIPLPIGQSALVFLGGFTMAISPGKFGEVLKALLVRNLVGTEVGRTTSVVMVERLTDVAGLLLLSGLGATALPHGRLLLGTVAALLVLAIAVLRTPALSRVARRLIPERLLIRRVVDPVRGFLGAGRALLAPGVLAVTVLLSIVSWFFECLAFFLILRGLEAELSVLAATFLYAFASLAGAMSMLPGGLGVAEGSLTGLLVSLGTAPPRAAAATLLVRALTLWLAVGLGLATLALAFRGAPQESTAPASR